MNRSYNLKSPKRIQIQPTDRCNLDCRFCLRKNYVDKSKELSPEKWGSIIDEIREIKPERFILVGGGEPLVRRDVSDLAVDKLGGSDIYTSLVTNGTLLDEDIIDKIVSSGWNHILFSLHAPHAELSDFIRGKTGSFTKTVQNIRNIIEEKRNTGSNSPTMAITTVINEFNYRYFRELKELVKEYDLEPLTFRILTGSPERCDFVPEEDINILKEQISELSSEIRVEFEFHPEELDNYYNGDEDKNKPVTTPFCLSSFFEMAIFSNGNVGPCCFMYENIEENDNVRNRSVREVWEGEKFERLRIGSILGNPPEICEKCLVSSKEMSDLKADFDRKYSSLLKEPLKSKLEEEFEKNFKSDI